MKSKPLSEVLFMWRELSNEWKVPIKDIILLNTVTCKTKIKLILVVCYHQMIETIR